MKSELFWEFLRPLNLSSSCDYNYTCVKHVSFKNVIFGRYKLIKKPLRIDAKSLSDALAPPIFFLLAALASGGCARLPHLAEVPIVCQILSRKAGQNAFVD